MKTLTQEVYVTDDGKTFTDVDKARTYEAQLKNEVILDQFCASLVDKNDLPVSERTKSRMRNDILKFLTFVDGQADTAAETKKEAKKAA